MIDSIFSISETKDNDSELIQSNAKQEVVVAVVVLLFYVHGKHLRSCRDGQLTLPHFSWAGLDVLSG